MHRYMFDGDVFFLGAKRSLPCHVLFLKTISPETPCTVCSINLHVVDFHGKFGP